MQIEVLLFASLGETAGKHQVKVEVPDSITVAELVERMEKEFPALAGRLAQVRVAIDQEFSQPADPVPANAEIALIPPVSGG